MARTLEERRARRKARKTRRKSVRAQQGELIRFMAVGAVDVRAKEGSDVVRFSMTAYSGGKLYVDGFPHPVVVDLSAVEVKGNNGSIPITLDHDSSQRVGHSEQVNVSPRSIEINGVASAATPYRDEVVASARGGFQWQASIEGRVLGRKTIPEGQQVTVNGRTFDGPVIVARPFMLRATSFVSSGGDEDNVVRLAASESQGGSDMDPKFKAWLEANGFEPDTVAASEGQSKILKAQWESSITPAEEPQDEPAPTLNAADDHVATLRAAAAKEMDRQAAIQKLCAGEHPELQAKAIREGWTSEKTELELLRATRAASTPAIHVTDAADVKDGQALEAALCRSVGKNPEEWGYGEKALDASDKLKAYGLHELMADVVRATGKHFPRGKVGNEHIRAAFEAEQELKANEGFSSLSLTGVLSNVANKALLEMYERVAGIRRTICRTRQVNDFKTHTSYRLTGNGKLLKLGPDGEIKHSELSEDSYTNSIDTYARMIALTRKDIINDDLGAFMQIPESFGRLTAITEEEQTFTVLLAAIDGGAFFTTGRGNFQTGAATALAISSLTSAEKLADEMVDDEDNPVFFRGQYLLVPPATKVLANQLMNETRIIATDMANSASTTAVASNPHANKYEVLTSPYFGAKHALTGGSNLHWLLISNPMDIAVMEFAELRGQSGPVIESAETDFNTLGMQWRAYRDFGVATQDYRGAIYSDGSN